MNSNFLLRVGFSIIMALISSVTYASDTAQNAEAPAVRIVPRKSIGDIVLGTKTKDLPPGAKLEKDGERGELGGIQFQMSKDQVDDIWIEDLSKFGSPLEYDGKLLPKSRSLEPLKKLFGGCVKVDPALLKWGHFFNCKSGLSIGTGIGLRLGVKSLP